MSTNSNKDHDDLRARPAGEQPADLDDAAERKRDNQEEVDRNPLDRLHYGSAGSGGAELEPPQKPKRP